MQATFGTWHAAATLLLIFLGAGYARGWRRLHRVDPALANPWRALAFAAALLLVGLALIWPLPGWSVYLLTARSLQKALLCMLAAPLFWLACPVHIFVWGHRGWSRRGLVWLHGHGWASRALRSMTQPMAAWFGFVALFLLWHDPASAQFLLDEGWAHHAAAWLLGASALLFWSHVVGTGPRLHPSFPAWLLLIYLLGAEIANMVAGITIAFTLEPIYAHYPALRLQLGEASLPLSAPIDQMTAGAVIWVFGSIVYIFGMMFVLHALFRRAGSTAPEPLPNWDSHENFIAPGLEHRVVPHRHKKSDDRSR
jgi:cytochrome c oxidase assembly factor CtaG